MFFLSRNWSDLAATSSTFLKDSEKDKDRVDERSIQSMCFTVNHMVSRGNERLKEGTVLHYTFTFSYYIFNSCQSYSSYQTYSKARNCLCKVNQGWGDTKLSPCKQRKILLITEHHKACNTPQNHNTWKKSPLCFLQHCKGNLRVHFIKYFQCVIFSTYHFKLNKVCVMKTVVHTIVRKLVFLNRKRIVL